MNTIEMTAKENARYAAMTGAERISVMQYLQGALMGRYGPVSQAGQDSIRCTLLAMGAFF